MFVGTLGALPTTLSDLNFRQIRAKLLEPPYNSVVVSVASPNILGGHEAYSELNLRPLLHYTISSEMLAKSEDDYRNWHSFVELNDLFAESIQPLLKKDDIGTFGFSSYSLGY